jgi:hypothetical protein
MVFPDQWKIAYVIALFTKGGINLYTNVNIRENIQASTIKIRKTLFSSFKLDMEEKYLFKISAFSMDSFDNLKSFCGSERGGVNFEMVFPDQWKIAYVIALFTKGGINL